MRLVAWDVTANISFGRHYGFIEQEKDVNNLMIDSAKGLYYFAVVSQTPWVDYLLDKNPIIQIGPKPTLTGFMYAFGVVAQYQQELTAEGKKPGQVEHYLDRYIKLKETHPEIVDDAQVVNYLMLNVLAGGDTTSSTSKQTVSTFCKYIQHLGFVLGVNRSLYAARSPCTNSAFVCDFLSLFPLPKLSVLY